MIIIKLEKQKSWYLDSRKCGSSQGCWKVKIFSCTSSKEWVESAPSNWNWINQGPLITVIRGPWINISAKKLGSGIPGHTSQTEKDRLNPNNV